MQPDEMKALARRFREEFINRRDASVADDILSEEFVYHGPAMAPRLSKHEAKVGILASLEAMPVHDQILEQFVDGDRVVSRFATGGTVGEQTIDSWGIDIIRIADGQIAEMWVQFDTLTFAALSESGQ